MIGRSVAGSTISVRLPAPEQENGTRRLPSASSCGVPRPGPPDTGPEPAPRMCHRPIHAVSLVMVHPVPAGRAR